MRWTIPFIVLLCTVFWIRLPGQSLLPPGLPAIQVVNHDQSELCDYLFTEAINWNGSGSGSLALMFDRQGDVAWYESTLYRAYNFSLLDNGQVSYFTQGEHLILDSTMSLIGGLGCDQGFFNDLHDLIVTPDGRTFALCLQRMDNVDLSSVLTRDGDPGSQNGVVYTTVVQELDANGDLVKDWRSLSHYSISDCDSYFFQDSTRMNLNHPNSIDWDGSHILLSHRNNNQLLLIDWASGDIVWRMGGPGSDFTFVNDPGLHGQHDARFLGNNRISVFDNGVKHPQPVTRGLIYAYDTLNWTVSVDSEYPAGNLSAWSMGGFRVLPSGDVIRSNGHHDQLNDPRISMMHADGQPAIDIYYDGSYWSYRAQCHTPTSRLPRPRIECLPQGNSLQLSLDQAFPAYLWSNGATTASITVTDTGRYQVFVPYGRGQMGSYVLQVDQLNGQCPAVSSVDPVVPRPRAAKRIRTVDLLGREISQRQPGQIYVEVYSDGTVRKVIQY